MKRQRKKSSVQQDGHAPTTQANPIPYFPPAFEQVPIGVAYVSLEGSWLCANQKVYEITGYSYDELQNVSLQDITHPDDREKDLALMQNLLTDQTSTYSLEKRYVRKDLSIIWINLTVFLLHDVNHAPMHFVVTLEDITERKHIEEKYRTLLANEIRARVDAEQMNEQLKVLQTITDTALAHLALDELFHVVLSRLRYIMNADNIAILLLNEQNQTLTVRAVLGIEEVIAQDIQIPLGKGFAGRIAAQCQPLFTNDTKTVEIINPVLREQIQSLLGVPLVVKGRVLGVIHVGMKRIRNFTTEDIQLFQRVADRLALAIERALLYEDSQKAHQEVLAHAQMVERVYHQQQDFVSIVSHEFRTTLTGIQGFSDILRSTNFNSEKVREYASDIYTDSLRLLRMINDLLDVEQMKIGKMNLHIEKLDLQLLLCKQIEHFRATTQIHTIHLHINTSIPAIEGDIDKLAQMLSNLLSNAIKYSPQGGAIEVSCQYEGQSIHLRIQDQGIGIPSEALEKIFTAYSRIYSEKTRYIQGTGLGLSIVEQIVLMHDGKVWAESPSGCGAIFHVLLPIHHQYVRQQEKETTYASN